MDANHDIIILFLLYHSKIFGHLQLLEVFMLHFGNPQVSVFLHVKGPFCHVFFVQLLTHLSVMFPFQVPLEPRP
jgi:hypothetical protein